MRNYFNQESLTGVIGYPLKQSLSPLLHNYWIKKNEIQSYYKAFEIKNLKHINKAIRALNIKGLNVTIPYKKKIIRYLDEIDTTANKLEAVNTIKNINGILKGYNTDVKGFNKGLDKFQQFDKNRPIVVFGAGGAASSIIYSLVKGKFKDIRVMNRTLTKAKKFEDKYRNVKSAKWLSYNIINESGLIINTTSLGMIGYPKLPIKLDNTYNQLKVYDIVYNPLKTQLIKDAKKQNLEYVDGLTMFLGQAEESFRIWYNKKPKIDKTLLQLIQKKI